MNELSKKINKEISRILLRAINGSELKYRDNNGVIRWGAVEKDLHLAVDDHIRWNISEKDLKA